MYVYIYIYIYVYMCIYIYMVLIRQLLRGMILQVKYSDAPRNLRRPNKKK